MSCTVGEGQSSLSVPLAPSRAGDWGGCTQTRPGHPAAVIPSHGSRAAATHPVSHGKWEDNKLALHLFPGNGWFLVCTITSGPLTSPTRATGCPKSSSGASPSAVPGMERLSLPPDFLESTLSSPAQGWHSPSTPSWKTPGKQQLGFYSHHTVDLWVLGRWKLQDLTLGERAEAR